VLASLDPGAEVSLLAMHLSEVEDETGTIADLFAALRSAGHHSDRAAIEEALGELVISFEHAQSHLAAALAGLQERLDLQP